MSPMRNTFLVKAGVKVRINGLQSRKDLNGLIGTVMEAGPHSERVTVKVVPMSRWQRESGNTPHELVRIKPSNLQPVFETPLPKATQGLCPICMDVEMRTMMGDTQNYQHRGIAPRALSHIFQEVAMRIETQFTISCRCGTGLGGVCY